MKFNVGDRVEHKIFGKGKVVEINSGIQSNSTLVQFDVKHPLLHDGTFCKGVYKEKTCWHFHEDELDRLILLKKEIFTKKDLKEGDVLILRNKIRGVFNGEKTSIGNQGKCDFGKGKKEYIRIDLKDGETGIKLPYFKKDSMYKNMEVSNNYTLKELEL